MDAGQEQNAKADKRCLSLIGGEWDAFLAKMQTQLGKAPILAQNPTEKQHPSTKEHFCVCQQQQHAHSPNTSTPKSPVNSILLATKSESYPPRGREKIPPSSPLLAVPDVSFLSTHRFALEPLDNIISTSWVPCILAPPSAKVIRTVLASIRQLPETIILLPVCATIHSSLRDRKSVV